MALKCGSCGEADNLTAGLDSFQCLHCGKRTKYEDADTSYYPGAVTDDPDKPKRTAKKAAARKG